MEEHLEEAKVEVAEKVEEKEEDIEVEESTNAMEESTDIDKEEQEEVDEQGKAGQGDLFFSGTWSSHKCTGLRFALDHVLIITVYFLSTFDPHIVTVYIYTIYFDRSGHLCTS